MAEAAPVAATAFAAPRPRAWRAWLGGGALAIADQGCFAGASFALNLLLARWLAPSAYGAFTAGYAAFLLLAAIESALLTEPFSVYASARLRGAFRAYLGLALRAHWLALAPAAALAAAIAAVWRLHGGGDAAAALAGVAALAAGNLLLLLLRAASYARGRPAWSAAASATYAATTLALVVALRALDALDLATALAATGAAAGVAALALARRHRRAPDGGDAAPPAREVVALHARYGRWALGTTLVGWLCGNLHYAILGGARGLEALAQLRALDVLLLPYLQVVTALGQFLLPRVAARADRPRAVARLCLAIGAGGLAAALAVYATLLLGAGPIAALLYRRAIAGPVIGVVGAYAFVVVPYTASAAALIGLRGLARSDLVFAYSAAYAVAFAAGCAIGARSGLAGVAWGSVAAQSAMAVVAVAMLAFATRGPAAAGEGRTG